MPILPLRSTSVVPMPDASIANHPLHTTQYKLDGAGTEQLPLFVNGDTVAGSVKVGPQPGKKVAFVPSALRPRR